MVHGTLHLMLTYPMLFRSILMWKIMIWTLGFGTFVLLFNCNKFNRVKCWKRVLYYLVNFNIPFIFIMVLYFVWKTNGWANFSAICCCFQKKVVLNIHELKAPFKYFTQNSTFLWSSLQKAISNWTCIL